LINEVIRFPVLGGELGEGALLAFPGVNARVHLGAFLPTAAVLRRCGRGSSSSRLRRRRRGSRLALELEPPEQLGANELTGARAEVAHELVLVEPGDRVA
jgi:hypothetical protein